MRFGRKFNAHCDFVNHLEVIYHEEGRVVPTTDDFRYEYTLKDHLGNARLSFSDFNNNGVIDETVETMESYETEILQENHYYPFGMNMKGPWLPQLPPRNMYQYNGKELNEDLNLNWSDYGARWYQPSIGRWHSVDPLAEKYYGISPFVYVANNPLSYIDPFGMDIYDKNGVKADLSFDGNTMTIHNADKLDGVFVETLVETVQESKTGLKTVKSLNKKGDKHQLIVSDKVGVWQNEEGQFGRIVGLTEKNVDGFDSRISIFDSSEGFDINTASADDFELILNDGTQLDDKGKSDILTTVRRNFAGKKTHKSTQVALDGFSRKENKVFNQILKTMRADPKFGRITTLIHETVHARGNPNEVPAYKKEIKSFLQSDRNEKE